MGERSGIAADESQLLKRLKNDAMAIRKRLLAKKQLLCTAAPAASAFGGSA